MKESELELFKPEFVDNGMTDATWEYLEQVIDEDDYINAVPTIPTSADIAGFCAVKCYLRPDAV